MPSPSWLIEDLPEDDRPRERLMRHGPRSLLDGELVTLVLRSGLPNYPVLKMSHDLMEYHGGLEGFVGTDPLAMVRPGIGQARICALLAALEMGSRIARGGLPENLLSRPSDVARYLVMRYQRRDQEVMGALFLDARHRLVFDREHYRGTLHRAAVEPREILKECLLRGAAGFVLFHTHPSGDPTPSAEDLLFTRRMADAASVVGVELVDHMVIGATGRWASLRERGAW
jgi:DNA repair protein RadC